METLSDKIVSEVTEEGVLVLRIDNPRKLNAWDQLMYLSLR